MSKGILTTLFMILLGGILGGYTGELLGILIPNGFFHDLFQKGFTTGFESPMVLDLRILVLTFGVKLYLNLCGVAGMIAGLVYSR